MAPLYMKLIETLVVWVLYIVIRKACFKIIDKTLNDRLIQKSRGAVVRRMLNTVFLIVGLVVTLLIWGVKQADLAVFIGSALTVVGVAFFAQWSILSNVTSSLILFFNHPVRLNESIVILEGKDYVIEGEVVSIGLFFITLRAKEGEKITLPNNIFITKSVKRVSETASTPTAAAEVSSSEEPDTA